MKELPDLLAGVGFVGLIVGIMLVAGVGWALIVGGAVLLSTAVITVWRRHSA